MGYTINFVDNQMVTAQALNAVSTELGGEATAFEEGTVYGVEALNQISGRLISKGVSYGCELSVTDEQIFIGPGVLFFSDGKRVDIDAEGILLSYEKGVRQYVWFSQDNISGIIAVKCTETEPDGDDYIRLGEVTPSGEISGRPERAVMKNSYLGLNYTEEHTKSIYFDVLSTEETLVWEIEPEKVGCRYAIISAESESLYTHRHNFFCGYVDLLTGKSFGIHTTTPQHSSSHDWGYLYSDESGGMLQTGYANNSGMIYKNMLRFSMDSDNILRVYRSSIRTGYSAGNSLPSSQMLMVKLC